MYVTRLADFNNVIIYIDDDNKVTFELYADGSYANNDGLGYIKGDIEIKDNKISLTISDSNFEELKDGYKFEFNYKK